MKAVWVVFRKELVDALRDRRTLAAAFLTSVAMGPLVLLLLSSLIGDIERQAEHRVVLVSGSAHGPTLVNFLERQSFRVEEAPADHATSIRAGKLDDAVLVVPEDFERELDRGQEPVSVEVLGDGSRRKSAAAMRRAIALLQAFNQERTTLRQLMQGVPVGITAVVAQERDLANQRARSAQLMAMVPFFVLMAVLYGSMAAAMDTTAGERERGSLEPLLMAPAPRGALVVGKWAAVAAVGMLIAVLSCLSFMPAQAWMRSETLWALFQFGLPEALSFLAILLPFAGVAAAVLMAVAIRAKTFKEAQTYSAGVALAFTTAPMTSLFSQGSEAAWQLWVPALGQITLMNRVLRGESLGSEVAFASAACLAITMLALAYTIHSIRRITNTS
jgi:sodium transport system permease protein